MDMHPHAKGKLKFVSQYYRSALPIFSHQAIRNNSNVLIIDAFCDSGCYEDNTKGSPIVILNEWDNFLNKQPLSSNKVL